MASASADLSQNDKCLLTELADGTGVILHLETKFYYTLNATGVAVWKGITAPAWREWVEVVSSALRPGLYLCPGPLS